MPKVNKPRLCPICGGMVAAGVSTFTADLGSGVVVVRKVPAAICGQCGEEWLSDKTAKRLEKIAEETRKRRRLVEVLPFSD